jgi:hypothetical protein
VGAADLLVRVAGRERRLEPGDAGLVEPFVGHDQQLAHPVQRVVLAAAVTERGLLHPAAHVVERGVSQLGDVGVVKDQLGVAQPDLRVAQRGPVGRCRVECGDAYAGPPGGRLCGQPGT